MKNRVGARRETQMPEQETTNSSIPEGLEAREHAAFEALVEMCEKTGLDLKPRVLEVQGQYLQVELVGDDALTTFGRNGKSLDALQYLSNLIIGRRTGGDVRILLDAGNYRARRQETLENLAREYAALVRERQEECELDPLPAHERRIVHNALSGDDSIRTYSEGDDPDRRIIIAPR
jgi:spoIIIJ-associated protein